ncbi:MAG: hypothetical protein Q4D62_08595 [Planctomycetia bacterium]|nr:hypothetical protein [Planctomycetia bacterium]
MPVFTATDGVFLNDGEIFLNFADSMEVQNSYFLFDGTFSLAEEISVLSNLTGRWNLNYTTGQVTYSSLPPSSEVPEDM